MSEIQERHKKQLSVMRGYLEGKGYYVALDALELVRQISDGTRKDMKTPKFHHQLSVARLLVTLLPHMAFPEETIAAAFLHDLLEDHGDIWTRGMLEQRFGQKIADAVWTLSKKSAGMSKTYELYFAEMANCPISSVVKLSDRAYNIQTMQGVFSDEKQREYIAELDKYFFPMIRLARRNFPKQFGAYENLKILMRSQKSLIEHILVAKNLSSIDDVLASKDIS